MDGREIGRTIFQDLVERARRRDQRFVGATGAGENFGAFLTAAIASAGDTFFVIAPDQDAAERVAYEIETMSRIAGPDEPVKVCLFSSLEWTPYEFLSPSQNLLADRISALRAIIERAGSRSGKLFIVAPMAAVLQKTCPSRLTEKAFLSVRKGDTLDVEKLSADLVALGYSAEDPVVDLAQYAVRGGIVDVFVPGARYPVRIDLFGDTVEKLKIFNIEDQRAMDEVEEFAILPASEFIYGEAELEALFRNMNAVAKVGKSLEVNKLLDGVKITNVERYAPYMYDHAMPTVLDYMSKYVGSYNLVFLGRDTMVAEGAEYLAKVEKMYSEAKKEDPYALAPERHYKHPEKLVEDIDKNTHLRIFDFTPYDLAGHDGEGESVFDMNGAACQKFQGRFSQFVQHVRELVDGGNTVVMILPGSGPVHRMAEVLSPLKFSLLINDNFFRNPIARKTVYLNEGYLSEGFAVPSEKLYVFSSYEAYGERQVLFNKEAVFESRAKAKDRYRKIASHLELTDGDYVVHVNYGIGIYRGITLLSTGGRESDYLLIEYADSDKLYVPVDALHMLHKYVGVEGSEPRIGKLNDPSWKKQKSSARRSVEKLAAYLVTLYARRSVAKGYRFSNDNDLQRLFEESFQYKETQDQQQAIVEVKCDMEIDKPMDRLVCGDVGFGKTEVAIRAAFKACMDGKQVAFLAPTTILALQHYNTLMSRFATYPLRVELLSRFRTKSEQKTVAEKLRDGGVDVVVGTHRLIQKDIAFKDLGLLVVDEEQRFGVKHKERLKEFKHQLDILTLTATPIPRTLYMSLVGCRDISIINTPPAERLPIKTFVLRYSEDTVRDAVTRELMRRGQVYYVHNRIESIDAVAAKIASLVPGARVRAAHGQMDEKALEKIMLDFYEREFDVLVSTTIIENGLDIANVNTIIIERADTFGLSQLYQLRGRVGRSKNQAYAYFLFPHEAALSDIAKRRLQAMKEFSELGSGYKIAMRDLEIRGAGNLLGHEQHGHIHTIGFELYCRLLEDEVRKLKGEEASGQSVEFDCEIDINVNAYIPTSYINSTFQKIDIYKRMVGAADHSELSELSSELIDRFGKYPETVYNLFQVVRLKILGRALLVASVREEKKHVIFKFAEGAKIGPEAVDALVRKFGRNVSFAQGEGGMTLVYLQKQELKGDNLVQMMITALSILKG